MQRRKNPSIPPSQFSGPGISERYYGYDRMSMMYPHQGLLGLGPMNSKTIMLRIMYIVTVLLIFFIAYEELQFNKYKEKARKHIDALRKNEAMAESMYLEIQEEHKSLYERYKQLLNEKNTIHQDEQQQHKKDSRKDTTFRSKWIDSVSSTATGAQKRMSFTKTDANVETPVRVLVPIADGSEELETVTITDILKRFGAEVTVASVNCFICEMSQGLKIQADVTIKQASNLVVDTDHGPHGPWHLIVLPGGMPGATSLRDSKVLKQMLMDHHNKGGLIGAICASPSVILRSYGIIDGSRSGSDAATEDQKPKDTILATGYPSKMFPLNLRSKKKVVISQNIVTSQGPGTSILFAMKLGEELFGKDVADRVADDLLLRLPAETD